MVIEPGMHRAELQQQFRSELRALEQLEKKQARLDADRYARVERLHRLDETLRQTVADVRFEEPDGRGPNVSREIAERSFFAELALARRVSEDATAHLVTTARVVVNDLPATHAALGEGLIWRQHAETVVDQVSLLDPTDRMKLEATLLPIAAKVSPTRFRGRAKSTRERLHPETAAKRHEKALATARVSMEPLEDGMAELCVVGPAVETVAASNRISVIAQTLKDKPGETRSLAELRAAVAIDLLLHGVIAGPVREDGSFLALAPNGASRAGLGIGIRPEVAFLVPMMTILGRSDEAPVLEGYGPVDVETALRWTAEAPSFRRILTHPVTGAILTVDRTSYRIPKDLRWLLRWRDGTCRFPGCGRRAIDSELDHIDEWQDGGGTNWDNLVHLCKKHHTLKSMLPWREELLSDGATVAWMTPAGLRHLTDPAMTMAPVPPAPADDLGAANDLRPSRRHDPWDTAMTELTDAEGEFPF